MFDQDKALFEARLNVLIEADNAAEDADIGDIPDCVGTECVGEPLRESASRL